MTDLAVKTRPQRAPREGGPSSGRRWLLPVMLTLISLIWLFPLLLALVNYTNAWAAGDFGLHFMNSVIITVPAVILTLFLSCCVAFVVARFSFKFNLAR